MPDPTNEADVLFNRANVALAKSQRLVASWLPPRTTEEVPNTKSEEETEREEKETFAPIPELLGLGAPLPKDIKDGDGRRQELSSNDKLRKQLLGKDFAKLYGPSGSRTRLGLGTLPIGSKPRPAASTVREEMRDDNDEEGRSSLGKPKRGAKANRPVVEEQEHADEIGTQSHDATELHELHSSSKRARNYLDEVLAEKMRKKAKKKQKSKLVLDDGQEKIRA
ncbi:hypothetical protein MMC13_001410 [Lambiella insularis]|nr:hypothetical protein [Lambiella insularis]